MTKSNGLFYRHRPHYHFLPPKNWMNDPNGLIQFNGEYHLFYQHNPFGADWGNMTWGHAVSTDLVHWKHLPLALHPDQPYDKEGVFSGCAVNHEGEATILYTGVRPEVQCLATSRDMIRWEKSQANPVIAQPPAGMDATGFRDPFVWREGENWYMVLGSGEKDVGGAVLLYRSKDLEKWEYLQPMYSGKKEETGENWECPNFFPLGEKWVLILSPQPWMRAIYFTGRYDNYTFTPEVQGEIDLGGYFYAPQVFRDEQDRRIMFGWVFEGRSPEAQKAAGWAGVMSLPRILSLADDKTLRFEPAGELETLRGDHRRLTDIEMDSGSVHLVEGDCLEAIVTFDRLEAASVGVTVRKSPGGEEATRIVYHPTDQTLAIDRSRSSGNRDDQHEMKSAPLTLNEGEPLTLRVFVDNSILEVYANSRVCLTGRMYPDRDDSLGVELFADNGIARARTVDVWRLKSMGSFAD